MRRFLTRQSRNQNGTDCQSVLQRYTHGAEELRFESLRVCSVISFIAMTLILAGEVATNAATVTAKESKKPPYPSKLSVDRSAEPLKIAFISYANPQQVAKDIGPIVNYLEPFVGRPIEGFVTLDYGSSIVAMRGQQADLATIDPLAFMMAHEQIDAKPLLLEIYSEGEPTYHSCIWVRKDSGIENIEDLKGKTIAFADQVDMSGHLLPREIFVQKKLLSGKRTEGEFFKQIYYAGGDEQAIRAVFNKFVDAAGISQYASLLLRPEERDKVATIARSIQSPSHLVMARKGLSDEICGRIKQALLALDPTKPEDNDVLTKLYGVQGYVEATLSDFSEVAKVAAQYGFVKEPERFAASSAQRTETPINVVCPFSSKPVDSSIKTVIYKGSVYGFCCEKCVKLFNRYPEKAIAKIEANQSR